MKVLITLIVLLPVLASADYSQCILENMKGVVSDVAAEEIKKACETKAASPSALEDTPQQVTGTGWCRPEDLVLPDKKAANKDYLGCKVLPRTREMACLDLVFSHEKLLKGTDFQEQEHERFLRSRYWSMDYSGQVEGDFFLATKKRSSKNVTDLCNASVLKRSQRLVKRGLNTISEMNN
jgi:hypothetical protein